MLFKQRGYLMEAQNGPILGNSSPKMILDNPSLDDSLLDNAIHMLRLNPAIPDACTC